MRSKIKNCDGSALLIALCLMGMLTLVGLAAVTTSTTDIDLSFNQVNSDKAFYIAEAGAQRALAKITVDPTWDSGFASVSMGNGTYSVTITDSSTNAALVDTILVTSTGSALEAEAQVELTLAPEIINPFTYAMFAKDTIDIRNSMRTDSYNSDSGSYFGTLQNLYGDVGTNGNVWVKNGAVIGGDVSTSMEDGDSVNAGAIVNGTITDQAPEQNIPEVPASEWLWAEANNDAATGMSGAYSLVGDALTATGSVTLTSGVYFFSSITLKNTADLTVAPGATVEIYVTGDIEMKNSSAINSGGVPSDVAIYSQGDFILKNSGDIAATFYSPDGVADLRNSGEFFGSIVAGKIIAHNSADFHYDRRLGSIQKKFSDTPQLVAWREL